MKNRIAPWLAVPPVLYLTALFVGPACVILAYSLAERDLSGGVRPAFSWVAWQMATDAITLRIVGRTLFMLMKLDIHRPLVSEAELAQFLVDPQLTLDAERVRSLIQSKAA